MDSGISRRGSRTFSNDDIPELHGRVIIVTGAVSGLGMASAIALASRGAHVIATARSDSRADQAVSAIRSKLPSSAGSVDPGVMDHADLSTVTTFAEGFLARRLPLHALMNNAGISFVPYNTIHGVESHLLVNHLSHFHLTNLLLPILTHTAAATGDARVVNVSSIAHRMHVRARPDWDAICAGRGYAPNRGYGISKLANILHVRELTRRLGPDVRIFANAAHPGAVDTDLFSRGNVAGFVGWMVSKVIALSGSTPEQGALTQLYLSVSPDVPAQGVRGQYFVPTARQTKPSRFALDDALAEEL